jgi:hypothetical protein
MLPPFHQEQQVTDVGDIWVLCVICKPHVISVSCALCRILAALDKFEQNKSLPDNPSQLVT